MALPQHIVYGVGGTVFIDYPRLPSNACVAIYNGQGGEVLPNTLANISTINTTLNAAVSKGATTIVVNSNTAINVNSKLWIQDDPEEILVRKVNGQTVSTRRPIMLDHVSGSVCEGSRVQYTVNAATANSYFMDGYAAWNIEGKLDSYTALECTKYPLKRLATAVDVADIEPKIYYLVDTEVSLERLLDLGHEEVLKRIGQIAPDQRVRVMPASESFRTATAIASLYLFYASKPGQDAKEMMERFEARLDSEIKRIVPQTPRDPNQDGKIEADEKFSVRTRKLVR